MRDLGGAPGGGDSTALAINGRGQAVGQSGRYWFAGPSDTRALLWQEGRVHDLNDCIPAGSGWVLASARGINDRGWIVGAGKRDGRARAFLLLPAGTPVP